MDNNTDDGGLRQHLAEQECSRIAVLEKQVQEIKDVINQYGVSCIEMDLIQEILENE